MKRIAKKVKVLVSMVHIQVCSLRVNCRLIRWREKGKRVQSPKSPLAAPTNELTGHKEPNEHLSIWLGHTHWPLLSFNFYFLFVNWNCMREVRGKSEMNFYFQSQTLGQRFRLICIWNNSSSLGPPGPPGNNWRCHWALSTEHWVTNAMCVHWWRWSMATKKTLISAGTSHPLLI